MSITLPADVESIVNSHVARGDFASGEEMVAAAIRLFDQRKREKERQITRLRQMLQEAVDEAERGEWLDPDEVFEEVLAEIDSKASTSP